MAENDLVFRQAALTDADAVAALVNAAYRPGFGATSWTHESELVVGDRTSPNQVAALIGDANSTLLLGVARDGIVACVAITIEDKVACIGLLAVRPDLQTAGIGKRVLARAEKFAICHNEIDTFHLRVLSARNELIAFYERRGYRSIGTKSAYPQDADIGRPRFDDLIIQTMHKPVNNPLSVHRR